MKRSYLGVLLLCLVLFLNLVCTQYTINMYFAQRYEQSIVLALVNILIFPVALLIYRREKQKGS